MTNDAKVAGMPEGEVTGMIESQTSQIPSSAYLGAAIGSDERDLDLSRLPFTSFYS
jgi:hypothetical protein